MPAMICASCQNILPEGAAFCSSCGSALNATHTLQNAETLKQIPTTNDQLSQTTQRYNAVPQDSRIGLILDSKYQLLTHLGEGGMGSVYRARRLHIGDDVAVKLLSRDLIRDQSAVERFRREARSAAMISHPNVVSIHDFSAADDQNSEAYIVMELVRGESLRKVLEHEGPLAPERAVGLLRDICAGVGVAHRQGLLHRDLKPDNVIVTPPLHPGERETAKVVDFGLAKVRDAANVSPLTQTGTLLGTLYYMSPEQCRGEELDASADVYSLGAMLYEMLSGRPPFTANSPAGLISKHLSEAPPAFPQQLHIGPALAQACFAALAKNPEVRQNNAIKFAEELQAALLLPHHKGTVPIDKRVGVATQSRRGPSTLGWVAGIVALFALAVLIIGVGLAVRYGMNRVTDRGESDQNSVGQTNAAQKPNQRSNTEVVAPPTAVTMGDLRGTWVGTYGPLNGPATLVIKRHDGSVLEGVLQQGAISVAFTGTIGFDSIHLKQTRVISGEGWSLGSDVGTVSSDGIKMSGTGQDAAGGAMGMSYQWSFTRR